MIYPNQIHSYSSVGEVGMLLIIADMDSIGEFQEELTYYDMESPCFQKSMLSRYGQMVLDILADIGLHKELRPFRQDKGLLMALLADMYENIPVIKKDKPSDLNITQKLLQYINDNITGELTAQKVAKELGISPYYLSHIFSSQLNISFPSYVAQQRMILACNLLKDSRKTVTEISYECLDFLICGPFTAVFRKGMNAPLLSGGSGVTRERMKKYDTSSGIRKKWKVKILWSKIFPFLRPRSVVYCLWERYRTSDSERR